MNHTSLYHSHIAKLASKYLCIFASVFSLRRKGCARGGVASCMKGCIGKIMYISKTIFKLNWFNCNSKLFSLIYLNACLFSARF